MDLVTFFFGLPFAVEGLTRIPFQNRRNSLFLRAANKEKNEASWSLSPEAPLGEGFYRHQTSSQLRPTFHPEVAGVCQSQPSSPCPGARPQGR